MAIEKSAGKWADDQPRKDREERCHARKRGRAIRSEHEKYDCHADHGLADASDLHPDKHPPNRRHAQQRAIRPIICSHRHLFRISNSIAELRQAKKNLLIMRHADATRTPRRN